MSGRDVLVRVAQGALTIIGTAVLVTAVCLALGLLIGLVPNLATGRSRRRTRHRRSSPR